MIYGWKSPTSNLKFCQKFALTIKFISKTKHETDLYTATTFYLLNQQTKWWMCIFNCLYMPYSLIYRWMSKPSHTTKNKEEATTNHIERFVIGQANFTFLALFVYIYGFHFVGKTTLPERNEKPYFLGEHKGSYPPSMNCLQFCSILSEWCKRCTIWSDMAISLIRVLYVWRIFMQHVLVFASSHMG